MSGCVVRCLCCVRTSLISVDRARLVWIGWKVSGCVGRCLCCVKVSLIGVDRARLMLWDNFIVLKWPC